MLKQKLYAIILAIITIWFFANGIGTLAIITIPMALFLFFSKFDFTKHER